MATSPCAQEDLVGLDDQVSANDRALIAEAVRRVEGGQPSGTCDRAAILSAVMAALRGGRRDLFGLVKAGNRAL